MMHTADPAVISQITTRRNDFPKPTAIYRSLDIYGKNVVSTEGAIWRQHRKSHQPTIHGEEQPPGVVREYRPSF